MCVCVKFVSFLVRLIWRVVFNHSFVVCVNKHDVCFTCYDYIVCLCIRGQVSLLCNNVLVRAIVYCKALLKQRHTSDGDGKPGVVCLILHKYRYF